MSMTDDFGTLARIAARKAAAAPYRPPRAAKCTRIVVNCATGERTIERLVAAPPLPPIPAPRPAALVLSVYTGTQRVLMRKFVKRMADAGYTVDGAPYCWEHLVWQTRRMQVTKPRHVCIWLVRQLLRPSWHEITKHFWPRFDHTSAIHACERIEAAMRYHPALREVADAILAEYAQ